MSDRSAIKPGSPGDPARNDAAAGASAATSATRVRGDAIDARVRHRADAPAASSPPTADGGDPSDLGLGLPHERDETAAGVSRTPPPPEMRRAARDIAQGQVDTDRRGDAAEVFDRAFEPGGPQGHDARRDRPHTPETRPEEQREPESPTRSGEGRDRVRR